MVRDKPVGKVARLRGSVIVQPSDGRIGDSGGLGCVSARLGVSTTRRVHDVRLTAVDSAECAATCVRRKGACGDLCQSDRHCESLL